MSKIKEIKEKIKSLIDYDINPSLAMHEGSCTLHEVEIEEDYLIVKLSFQGSCNGCPASSGETRAGIEFFLREELSANNLIVININEQKNNIN